VLIHVRRRAQKCGDGCPRSRRIGNRGVDAAAQFIPHGTANLVPAIDPPGAHEGNLIFGYRDMAGHYRVGGRRSPRTDLRSGDAYLKATARALRAPVGQAPERILTPLAAVPFALRDRFGDLYLDSRAAQTRLQRRLSRLEATFERQLDGVRDEYEADLATLRRDARLLLKDNDRLRLELKRLEGRLADEGRTLL